ncbi:hypothetical protein ACQ86N_21850 [Puia sp. P3]|uniref:hypothetical protein n=1 Tax=Puia sp. P3 TaxID=3423952 RepID=UPI003D67FD4D
MHLKAFLCQVQLSPETIVKDQALPSKKISKDVINQTFREIQEETKHMVENGIQHMRDTTYLAKLIINPKVGMYIFLPPTSFS